jgi:5'-3' exonuclease
MAIEKLYNQFNKTFNISYKIISKLNNIKHVFFDFNSVIHNSISDCEFNENMSEIEKDNIVIDIVIKNFVKHIFNCIDLTNPINIYIFIDGVPSMNKINEQRHRKIVAFLENKLLNKKNIWEKSKIAPGTNFMNMLADRLRNNDFLKLMKKNNIIIKYISDSLEYDEAEIKIMKYLQLHFNENDDYIVYSPDADFILLLLSFGKLNINIIKINIDSNQIKPEIEYFYISTSKLFSLI